MSRSRLSLSRSDLESHLDDADDEEEEDEDSIPSSSAVSPEHDFLSFEEVVGEERAALDGNRNRRQAAFTPISSKGQRGEPFSVAFSGGGIRAASFQLGVLWRLGEAGLLENVEHMSAVSGGAWAATAYVSQMVDAGSPRPGQTQREWHRSVVAKTICRVLRNMPFMARDLGKDPCGRPSEGSSCLPRVFDIPMLIGALVWSIIVRTVTFLSIYIIPSVEVVEIFFGKSMRQYFCSYGEEDEPSEASVDSQNMLLELCSGPLQVFFVSMGAAIALRLLTTLNMFSKLGSMPSLWLHGFFASVARVAALMSVLVVIVGTTTFLEKWSTSLSFHRGEHACAAYYLHMRTMRETCNGTIGGGWLSWESRGMYHGPEFYEAMDLEADQHLYPEKNATALFPELEGMNSTIARGVSRGAEELAHTLSDSLIPATWTLLVVTSLSTLIFIPFFPRTIATIFMLALPVMVLAIFGSIVQWRVFGSLRRLQLFSAHHAYYRRDIWARVYQCSLVATMITLPFYSFLRGNSHKFYRRSLRRAFFASGKEMNWGRIMENPYCPVLILNATAIDYIYPGNVHPLNHLSVTPRHTGGTTLGFLRTRASGRVSKAMALSGAAHDAVILGKVDHMKVRFWLEMFGVGVGENIHFHPQGAEPNPLLKWAGKWMKRALKVFGQNHDPEDTPSLLRALPSYLLCQLVYCFLFGAEVLSRRHCGCRWAETLFLIGISLMFLMVILSFFAFLPCLDWLLYSPVVRTIHQVTGFYHRAGRPPSLLYVTDGMIEDNTGVMNLLQRECRRILLVYAGAQKGGSNKFGFVKKIADAAVASRIASIYDLEDPRRHWQAAVHQFEADPESTCLQLGILYGWDSQEGPRKTGRLLILRLHVPPSLENMPCQPLVTEDEVLGSELSAGSDSDGDDALDALPWRARDLRGCWCDCCHRLKLRCPRTFPYPPTGMQFLSPQVTSSLVRLGYLLAQDTAEELVRLCSPGAV